MVKNINMVTIFAYIKSVLDWCVCVHIDHGCFPPSFLASVKGEMYYQLLN